MRLCLHICCAPCATIPCKILKEKFDIEGFFYNPNIDPALEYQKRSQSLQKYSSIENLKVTYPEYDPDVFKEATQKDVKWPQRCKACWKLRLKKTAQSAKDNKFDCFSTTLLISPYQDNEALRCLGLEVAKEVDIEYFYQDFRPYFKQSRALSKELGLYMQKYCGCAYSKNERLEKSNTKHGAAIS